MYAIDFEYDGIRLSDYGMMICTFNGNDSETVSSGSDLTFNLVKSIGSDISRLCGAKYEESYSATFQICKNDCYSSKKYFSPLEVSSLQRWLCRKDGFHEFKIIQNDYEGIHWNVTFSAKQILFGGRIVGMELTLFTDSPYAYGNEQSATFNINSSGTTFSLYDQNDEIGYIYPTVKVTNTSVGNLSIINSLSSKGTIINLENTDTIILNGTNKTIVSENNYDLSRNKFNFTFPKLINTFDNRENIFTVSGVDGNITFSYCPKIKIGL